MKINPYDYYDEDFNYQPKKLKSSKFKEEENDHSKRSKKHLSKHKQTPKYREMDTSIDI